MSIPDFLESLYEGQKRKTGENATSHFYAVKEILETAGVTEKYILDAALLHDVLEDTPATKGHLVSKFGKTIANMVEILSKEEMWHTRYCKLKSYVYTLETCAIYYPEIILIKMADRLHNLQTIHVFSPKKKEEYLIETTDYLMPIFEKAKCFAPRKEAFIKIFDLIKREVEKIHVSFIQ